MVQVSKVSVMFLLLVSAILMICFYMKMEWKNSTTSFNKVVWTNLYSWDV